MIIKAEFKWNKSVEQLLRDRNLESGGKVQAAIDNAVLRYIDPYVPMETGVFKNKARQDSSPGKIVYNDPRARYLYYGEVYGPNIPRFEGGEIVGFFSPKGQPKHPTGRELHYRGEPMRGAFWFERMKADHGKDILKEAQDAANKQY